MSFREKKTKESEVFVLFKILGVGKIDWSEQTFPLRIGLEQAVPLSKEEHNEFNKTGGNYSPNNWPQIYPMNALSVKREKDTLTTDGSKYRVIEYDGKICLMKEMELFQGKFQVEMDLTNFPFDYQFVELIFNVQDTQSRLGAEYQNEVRIRPRLGGAVFGRFFAAPQGECSILTQEIGYCAQDNLFFIVFQIKRNWVFYFWRIFVSFALITLASPFCLINKFGDLGTALMFLVGLLLLLFAVLFTFSPHLKAIKGLTYIDKYTCSAFIFIFIVFFQRSSVTNAKTSSILFWVDISAWTLGHLLVLVTSLIIRKKEKRKIYGKPINWKISKN